MTGESRINWQGVKKDDWMNFGIGGELKGSEPLNWAMPKGEGLGLGLKGSEPFNHHFPCDTVL